VIPTISGVIALVITVPEAMSCWSAVSILNIKLVWSVVWKPPAFIQVENAIVELGHRFVSVSLQIGPCSVIVTGIVIAFASGMVFVSSIGIPQAKQPCGSVSSSQPNSL